MQACFSAVKIEIFHKIKTDIYLTSTQIIDCVCTLGLPLHTPVLLYKNRGSSGYTVHGHVLLTKIISVAKLFKLCFVGTTIIYARIVHIFLT